ncbi:hypothetical protein [Sphingomonas sp.]|uniref:hypothetical protein n=1 Tax=Sphingomonas sp. TaxID=28214 RepID=UPI0035C7FCA7
MQSTIRNGPLTPLRHAPDMDFTEEERRAWHEARRRGDDDADGCSDGVPAHVCLHCGNEFVSSAGVVTEDAAICDVCNGD